MPEGRVPDVVPERDRFDQLLVQPEEAADAAGDAAHQLNMQPATADVVVFDEGKHLGFPRVAGVGRDVDDFFDVARERGSCQRRVVMRVARASRDISIVEGARVSATRCAVGLYRALDFRVEREV